MASKDWEVMQVKTFTNWVNSHLKKQGLAVTNLATDFEDGILLIKLIEGMSGSSLGKYDAKPKMRIHQVQNLNLALNFVNAFVEKAGIRTKYSAENVLSHDLKLILGMTWVLIHKFALEDISEEELSAKEGLLLWVQKSVNGGRFPGVNVTNFHSQGWTDGLAFCALIARYRPDLLDFSTLDQSDRLGNLTKAFDIADRILGIPALLDPADLAEQAKADEKSVMTQVSYYWKAFAASKKNDLAARRINKVIQRLQTNEQTQAEYEQRVRALLEWSSNKVSELSSTEFGNSLSAVQTAIRDFIAYKASEKPSKTSEKLELEILLNNLRDKQKSESAPLYEPASDLSSAAIESAWEKLAEAEAARDRGLREALQAQKRLSVLEQRFKLKLDKLNHWASGKKEFLQSATSSDSIATAEAKLKIQDASDAEVQAIKNGSIDKLNALGQELADAKHASASENAEGLATLSTSVAEIDSLAASRRAALDEELSRQRGIEQVKLQFAASAETFNLWAEDSLLILAEPVAAISLADAKEQVSSLEQFSTSATAYTSEVDALRALSTQLSSSGAVDNIFSRFTLEDIERTYSNVLSAVESRRAALGVEVETQQQHEQLVSQFASSASAFVSWCDAQKASVAAESGAADLEQQLSTLKAFAAEASAASKAQFAPLETLYSELVAANIAENSPVSLPELTIQLQSLNSSLLKKEQLLEQQILAAKNIGVSAEQLAEIRSSFQHFDKDKSNSLNRFEMKACLSALMENTSDEELNSLFALYDVDGDGLLDFAEYSAFMIKRLEEKDRFEDVLASFQLLANEAAVVSEAQLRSAFSPEQFEFLASRMPRSADGSFDYNTYVRHLFSRE